MTTENVENYLHGRPYHFLDPDIAAYKERAARLCEKA